MNGCLSRYFVPLRNETKELRLPTCHIQYSTAVRQAETLDEFLSLGRIERRTIRYHQPLCSGVTGYVTEQPLNRWGVFCWFQALVDADTVIIDPERAVDIVDTEEFTHVISSGDCSFRRQTLASPLEPGAHPGFDPMSRRPGNNLIQKTISLAVALTTGRRVSDERIRPRRVFRYVRIRNTRRGRKLNCGICGCRVRGRRGLVNLARYEETRRWGCKHPNGSRWQNAGVRVTAFSAGG